MILSNKFILFASLLIIQVTRQTSHNELYNEGASIEAGNLRQNKEIIHESNEGFKLLKDENDKKLANVKVSYNGEVVYDNNRYVTTTTRPRWTYSTTTRRRRTYSTTTRPRRTYSTETRSRRTYSTKSKPKRTYANETRPWTYATTNRPRWTYRSDRTTTETNRYQKNYRCKPVCNGLKCNNCYRVKKYCTATYGRSCKIRECRDTYNRACESVQCRDSYDRPCNKRDCDYSYNKPCKRPTWNEFWNYGEGNQIKDVDSLCKQCEKDSFIFGSSLSIIGFKDSLCSACKPAMCTDEYGNEYECSNTEIVKVGTSNSGVSISVSGDSYFDTYQKLRDAVADPNALPKDFHF